MAIVLVTLKKSANKTKICLQEAYNPEAPGRARLTADLSTTVGEIARGSGVSRAALPLLGTMLSSY